MIYINYLACIALAFSVFKIYKLRLPRDKYGKVIKDIHSVSKEEIFITPWSEMRMILYLFFGSLGIVIVSNVAVGFF